jgi:hypothetical protein
MLVPVARSKTGNVADMTHSESDLDCLYANHRGRRNTADQREPVVGSLSQQCELEFA